MSDNKSISKWIINNTEFCEKGKRNAAITKMSVYVFCWWSFAVSNTSYSHTNEYAHYKVLVCIKYQFELWTNVKCEMWRLSFLFDFVLIHRNLWEEFLITNAFFCSQDSPGVCAVLCCAMLVCKWFIWCFSILKIDENKNWKYILSSLPNGESDLNQFLEWIHKINQVL